MNVFRALSRCDAEARALAGMIFLQMLPATMLVPAIRPLISEVHGAEDGVMHAFMAVNMLGALVIVPLVGALADRTPSARLLTVLCVIDGCLLVILSRPMPVSSLLAVRFLEGGAHVGAATLLLVRASSLRRRLGDGRAMGMAGGSLMMSIALGSTFGGILLTWGTGAPLLVGGATAFVTALASLRFKDTPGMQTEEKKRATRPRAEWFSWARRLIVPLSAAFAERFTVGCIVVSFALYATRVHGVADSTVGILLTMWTLPFALLMYPASRLGDKTPRASILLMGGVIYGAALAAIGVVPRNLLLCVMVVAGISSAMMYGTILCYVSKLSREHERCRAMAAVNGAGSLGMLLGPAVAGVLSSLSWHQGDPESTGRTVFWVAALCIYIWLAASSRWLLKRVVLERTELQSSSSRPAIPVGLGTECDSA